MLSAAVLIGENPVGPTCAKRAGLLVLARKKAGMLRLPAGVYARGAAPAKCQQTLDLFAQEGTADG